MSKSIFFTGQPILNQLLNLIDKSKVKALARAGKYDHYYKHFDTYTHLITMLYSTLNKCTSSREVVSGMKACSHKLGHLGILKAPGKSTLCDGNKNRSSDIFEQIYAFLYLEHSKLLPDSRAVNNQKLFIADSSTITLFQEILGAAGRSRLNGKRKGGIKVHTLINAEQDLPVKINFTAANANDMTFLKEINLDPGSFIVFDKGYVDYEQYQRLSTQNVFFVTRQRKGARYIEESSSLVPEKSRELGVLNDQIIVLGTRTHAKKIKLKARMVTFFDKQKERTFEFLTNNFELPAIQIADLYKKRWQIEVLFKRIKQNFPLKYFLGDNVNAIKIQIWCAFIADLLLKLVQMQLKKKWAFSNLSSIIRLHLMSYINLFAFLNNPDKLASARITNQLVIGGLDIGSRNKNGLAVS
ncbi:IS4 family transposase [Pedobacter steynii]